MLLTSVLVYLNIFKIRICLNKGNININLFFLLFFVFVMTFVKNLQSTSADMYSTQYEQIYAIWITNIPFTYSKCNHAYSNKSLFLFFFFFFFFFFNKKKNKKKKKINIFFFFLVFFFFLGGGGGGGGGGSVAVSL